MNFPTVSDTLPLPSYGTSPSRESFPAPPSTRVRVGTGHEAPCSADSKPVDQDFLQRIASARQGGSGFVLCNATPKFTKSTPEFSTPARPVEQRVMPMISPLDRAYLTLPSAEDVKEEMEQYLALAHSPVLPMTSPLDRAYVSLPSSEDVEDEMKEYLAHARPAPMSVREQAYALLQKGEELQKEIDACLARLHQPPIHVLQGPVGGTHVVPGSQGSVASNQLPPVNPLDRAYASLPSAEDVQQELDEYHARQR
ncbi:hypothetical protein [Ottowia thiooxydans]|uniref:Uncharacterized protein n=1 Tax=Ottowia thiooxydans TaxID=219182 RepID=A0ABV2QAY2_9BURK